MADTSGVAKRYVKALLELADEKRKLDKLARQFAELQALLAEMPVLRRLLEGTALPRDKQTRALVAVLQKAGADALLVQFVGAVGEGGRLAILPRMMRLFMAELAARRGEISAEVITATPLDSALTKGVKQAIQHIAKTDKIVLDQKQDASLLGGLIIRMQSRMIDTSLRTKLKRLEAAMVGAELGSDEGVN